MKNKTIDSCDHIGIFTNNKKRLTNFYTKKLGFKKEMEGILPKSIVRPIFGISSGCIFIKLVKGNMMIELFEPVSSRMCNRLNNMIGINHWGYNVSDKKKFVAQLKKKHVKIIEIKRNDRSVYFITDPDGNRIEIRDHKKSTKKPTS